MNKPYYKHLVWRKAHGKASLSETQYRNADPGNLAFGFSRGLFPVERDEWETAFRSFLVSCGFGEYGYCYPAHHAGDSRYHEYTEAHDAYYEDDVFVLRKYYWGFDDDEAALPNFLYKPTGYELRWYKYPLRDAYANKQLAFDQFKAMLDECGKSWLGGNF